MSTTSQLQYSNWKHTHVWGSQNWLKLRKNTSNQPCVPQIHLHTENKNKENLKWKLRHYAQIYSAVVKLNFTLCCFLILPILCQKTAFRTWRSKHMAWVVKVLNYVSISRVLYYRLDLEGRLYPGMSSAWALSMCNNDSGWQGPIWTGANTRRREFRLGSTPP